MYQKLLNPICVILLFISISCSQKSNESNIIEEDEPSTEKLSIGDVYQGGIIAYILTSSDEGYNSETTNGLIVAMHDLPNSNASAAKSSCENLIIDEFDDWYLPSLHELNLLYENKDAIADSGGMFDRNASAYWSSNSGGSGRTFVMSLNIGREISDLDEAIYNVRAVRMF